MRYLGLDHGTKTVGVAVSDALNFTAQRREIIRRKEDNKLRRTYARIEELCKEYDITAIIIGLPLNMDGTEGDRAAACREFAANVSRRTGIETILWDERLTSVEACAIMKETGIPHTRYKEYVDMIAAEIILQDYLDNGKDHVSSGR